MFNFENCFNITLRGNREQCVVPGCMGIALVADGIFDITPSGVEILSAPDVTRQMLDALRQRISDKKSSYHSIEDLRADIEHIHPSFSTLISTILSRPDLLMSGIGLILNIIQIWISLSQNEPIRIDKVFFGPTTIVEQQSQAPAILKETDIHTAPIPRTKPADEVSDEAKAAVRRWMALPKSKPMLMSDNKPKGKKRHRS